MSNKKLILVAGSIIMISSFAHADDNVNISSEAMQQTHSQFQNRMDAMSDDERALYKEFNETKKQDGTTKARGKGKGDGSGNKKRKGQGNKSNYGSGYGSRQGDGNSH